MTDLSVEGDVRQSYDPPMEERVARLEEDMRDVKSVLSRLEPMIIRIDATLTATLPNLVTKAELAELRIDVTKEIGDVRTGLTKEITDVRTDLGQEIANVRTDLGREVADLRIDLGKEVEDLRTDLGQKITDLRTEMIARFADVPTKTYLWGILGALITAYGAGLAALAVIR